MVTQDPAELARAYKKKNEQGKIRLEVRIAERIEAACEEVERLVECFKAADPGLKRLILFGSLAENRVHSVNFDIDIAFEGTKYLECLSIAMQSYFKVDLIDLKTVRSGIRNEIEQYGEVLFRA